MSCQAWGLSRAGPGRRGKGWKPGEAEELGRQDTGKLQGAGAAHRTRQAGSRVWGGVSGKRVGEFHGCREQ